MSQATTPTIIVRNTPTGWVADFSAHPEGAEAARLFGTTELLLPLTPLASFETVVKVLAEGHAGSRVIKAPSKSQLARITRQARRPVDA